MKKSDIYECIGDIIYFWGEKLVDGSDKKELVIESIISDLRNNFEDFDVQKIDHEINKAKNEYSELRELGASSVMYTAGKIMGLKIAKEIIFGIEKDVKEEFSV
ncbi:hypothetical protein [Clostridium botulinum]|uniref:hypothetical protein n=1 Tax=Clostridium botulinum TaxID=1491 RepID=UPI0007747C05|nr:hypothetical protein [Clostridium botulinum]NFL39657.1 hypothetical protein [Clostridium botulinum]NFL66495.1 hypothetical protein [Clostridium botulinum]NFN09557.1 hypothetical protein [Clostridium botulinum]NFN26188.1 hypothetical protein [Clostridium botulinum]NFN33119.1 hypothetical protein [Clostridium botulinum]